LEVENGADAVANVDTLRTDWLLGVAANVDKGVAADAAVDAVDNKEENQSFPPKTKPVKKESSTDSTEPLKEPLKVGDEVEVTGGRYKGAIQKVIEVSTASNGELQYRIVRINEKHSELNFDELFTANELKRHDWTKQPSRF